MTRKASIGPFVALLILFLTAGCGAMLERSSVENKFSRFHNCPGAKAQSTSGGYRVSGCGKVAFFSCFSTGKKKDRGVMGVLFDRDDTCIQEYVRQEEQSAVAHSFSEAAQAQVVKPEIETETDDQDRMKIRTSIPTEQGSFNFLAAPGIYPERFVISYGSMDSTKEYSQCSVKMWVDGDFVPIQIIPSKQVSHRVFFQVRIDDLEKMSTASRIAIDICAVTEVFPQKYQHIISDFYIQFKEIRARDKAKEEL